MDELQQLADDFTEHLTWAMNACRVWSLSGSGSDVMINFQIECGEFVSFSLAGLLKRWEKGKTVNVEALEEAEKD